MESNAPKAGPANSEPFLFLRFCFSRAFRRLCRSLAFAHTPPPAKQKKKSYANEKKKKQVSKHFARTKQQAVVPEALLDATLCNYSRPVSAAVQMTRAVARLKLETPSTARPSFIALSAPHTTERRGNSPLGGGGAKRAVGGRDTRGVFFGIGRRSRQTNKPAPFFFHTLLSLVSFLSLSLLLWGGFWACVRRAFTGCVRVLAFWPSFAEREREEKLGERRLQCRASDLSRWIILPSFFPFLFQNKQTHASHTPGSPRLYFTYSMRGRMSQHRVRD
jgi:hypothetical protein